MRCAHLDYFAIVTLVAMTVGASAEAATVLDNTTLTARAIERIIIVGSAILSIVLGYRLFSITTTSASRMLAEGKGFKIHFSQVGPGVFFALFGSAILSYAIYKAPEVSERGAIGSTAHLVEVKGAIGNGSPETSAYEDQLAAINTLHGISFSDKAPSSSEDVRLFEEALDILETARRDLINRRLGEGRFEDWAALKELRKTDPARLETVLASDNARRQRFNETDEALTTDLRGL